MKFAILVGMFLAYANGANDNFKGVATLYGSSAASYKKALTWATLCQVLGSMTALVLAQGLLATFSGKGLIPEAVLGMKSFSLSVGLAAALSVMLATSFGFPISTTHALTGALVGAAILASNEGVNLSKLGSSFFTPLLLSPILAALLGSGAYLLLHRLRIAWGIEREICLEGGELVQIGNLGHGTNLASDFLHFASGGILCFARALNDTPKVAAVLMIGSSVSSTLATMSVACLMAIGGIFNSRSIAETMSHRVTTMNPVQGLSANLVTSLLVIFASKLGLPVSTTHVSVGSLFGIGAVTRQANYRTMLTILIAWITTLPIAAILGAGLFLGFRLIF